MENLNKVSFDAIVSQLVKVFKSSGLMQSYNCKTVVYEVFSGWCGHNSPVSRPYYIERFGEDTVKAAEQEARRYIEQEQKEYEKSTYHMAELEAVNNLGTLPVVGAYMEAVTTWSKAEMGVPGVLSDMIESASLSSALVKVDRVETVPDSFFSDYRAADQLVQQIGPASFPGGDEAYQTPTGAKYITSVCACISQTGKYCFIDSEGYDYARYILFPANFKNLLSDEYQTAAKKIADRKAAEQKAAEEAAAARKKVYMERVKKWEKYMEPVATYEQAEKATSRDTPEGKKARRKLQSVRRSNILTMFKKACPGVKVSLSKCNGWGCDWELTYTDGPTLEEVEKITDFALFAVGRYVCDSSDDWDFKEDEHIDFARKYMGNWGTSGIKIYREMSDEKCNEITDGILSLFQDLKDKKEKDLGIRDFTCADMRAISDHFQVDYSKIATHSDIIGDFIHEWVAVIIRRIWDETSYYKTEDKQDEEKAVVTVEISDSIVAPVDGLELVEIAGGVAVVGDSKVTYRNRKEIKAHGCSWNREAKQWEATTPEAVEAVRKWFGVVGVPSL